MPILLDDIADPKSAGQQFNLTPKFFYKQFTGNGKNARGIFKDTLRPGRHEAKQSEQYLQKLDYSTKAYASGNDVSTRIVPFGLLSTTVNAQIRDNGYRTVIPALHEMFFVNEDNPQRTHDVFLGLTPQASLLYEDSSKEKKLTEFSILYNMLVAVVPTQRTENPTTLATTNTPPMTSGPHSYVVTATSWYPLDDAVAFIERSVYNTEPVTVNEDKLAEWMDDYDTFEAVSQVADQWATQQAADIMVTYLEDVFANLGTQLDRLNTVAVQLSYMENYTVSLDAYRQIYEAINRLAQPINAQHNINVALELSKQNLSLLMSHTLEDLNQKKGQLVTPPQHQPAVSNLPQNLSTQQRQAVMTPEPLVLTQAGAGTGKSTVIINRIQHLADLGVDMSEITVLSFTNAAADNIKERNPGVGSMTIARMIHEIYSLNFPNQEISTLDTILNSIDIHYPVNNFAREFRKHLDNVRRNEVNAQTKLNIFIERNRDAVIQMLNFIGQTTLELEIILVYQMIDTLQEPAEIQAKYLIIDEVQDNSIFEFIFTLKYVNKHLANLFIVGDASQTLYEFRNANPKALNTLEGSGVFATFQLTTNYRSNQEILDFANVHLADIEANQQAQLRLQANSLVQPTAETFQDKVQVKYYQDKSNHVFKENYPAYMQGVLKPWIEERIAKDEQVVILAFTRDLVNMSKALLEENFPNEHVANLTSERSFSSTFISTFIKEFWKDVEATDVANASFAVTNGISNNMRHLVPNPSKAEDAVKRTISTWWVENGNTIDHWVQLHNQGVLAKDEFMTRLRDNLLQFEIRNNSIRQNLQNQRNREQKELNEKLQARLAVSTVHGAKGLEFDHVIVLHHSERNIEEDRKRIYYVAFTRAMKSEFILSRGSTVSSRLTDDYNAMVKAYTDRDTQFVLKEHGLDPDTTPQEDIDTLLADFYQKRRRSDEALEALGMNPDTANQHQAEYALEMYQNVIDYMTAHGHDPSQMTKQQMKDAIYHIAQQQAAQTQPAAPQHSPQQAVHPVQPVPATPVDQTQQPSTPQDPDSSDEPALDPMTSQPTPINPF